MSTITPIPDDFKYFRYIIPTMILEYTVITLIFLYYKKCCRSCRKRGDSPVDEMDCTNYDDATGILSNPSQGSVKFQCQFEDTYESYCAPAKYVLFITRVLSLGYIGGVSVAASYAILNKNQWFYFTLWNVQLITLYLLLSICCSIIGFIHGNKSTSNFFVVKTTNDTSTRIIWSAEINRFAQIMHILMEVCGGNSFLIIAVTFIFLNPSFKFWNASEHFAPVVVMVVELFLNNIFVRFDHFPFNLAWPLMYLIFIWPIVYLGVIGQWPYFFLRTDAFTCFLYYTGLLIADFIFYNIWYGFSELKFRIRTKLEKKWIASSECEGGILSHSASFS